MEAFAKNNLTQRCRTIAPKFVKKTNYFKLHSNHTNSKYTVSIVLFVRHVVFIDIVNLHVVQRINRP